MQFKDFKNCLKSRAFNEIDMRPCKVILSLYLKEVSFRYKREKNKVNY